MDLYGNNSASLSHGNARRDEVRQFNDNVKQHNKNVTDTMNGLLGQQKTTETIKQAQDSAQALWTGSKMPDKVKAYKDWKNGKSSGDPKTKPTPEADATKPTPETETPENPESNPTGSTSDPPAEPVEEGGMGRPASEATDGAGADITESLENSGAKGALKTAGKEGGEEIAETLGSKLGGAAGKVAGGAFGAAMGGMDAYEDIKAGKIEGNNAWEKAGNVLQMGGAVADIVGMAFPPAALLGGVLDLASGATSMIGEKIDADKQADDTKDAADKDQETTEDVSTAAAQETVSSTVGRVMG